MPQTEPPGTRDEQDEALYVLTAALLTPAQFPGTLGDDFPEACARLGLPPSPRGYGLVLGQDGHGARWTVVVDDVSVVAVAIASWDCGMEYDLSPTPDTVLASLPGWPMALSVSAPGVPAPHDPGPEDGAEGLAPLAPPAEEGWGPAQRRLGADEIARQWHVWREQIADEEFLPAPAGNAAQSDAAEPVEATDTSAATLVSGSPADTGKDGAGDGDGRKRAGDADDGQERTGCAGPSPVSRGLVRRVLAEARGYLSAPPPPGRVRSAFATDEARMLRADGPGWSLVARTDDIAFVLLDEEPGEIFPVGRGPELPGLLTALDEIAVHPA
ncbi:hypothetical protein AB0J21_00240 [Streptomyces sp. NPDC049954]|uniref:hypothetical protein n=1 Tax=Streptomyces sp. NPDC049954 TaxID=3155779 RepID=UPI00343608AA